MTISTREAIIDILSVLDFERFILKKAPNLKLTCDSFDKLTQFEFRNLFYFLFFKLNRERCLKRFTSVFPSRDIQQETEFRKIAYDWINELNGKNKHCNFGTVLPISFQRLSGIPFINLIFKFANYVLHCCVLKSKTIAELQAQSPAMVLDKVETIRFVENFENKVKQLSEELQHYRTVILEKSDKLVEDSSRLNEEIGKLEKYGSIDEIKKVNNKLSVELEKTCKYLQRTLDSIKNQKALMGNVKTKEGFGEMLADSFRQFDELVELIKSKHGELFSAFKHAKKMNEQIVKMTLLLESSQIKMKQLEAKEQSLKEEILQTKIAQATRQQISDYLAPVLSLKLTIGNR